MLRLFFSKSNARAHLDRPERAVSDSAEPLPGRDQVQRDG